MTETTFEEEPGLIRVLPGHPGHGSTRRVIRVLPGCCTCRSFNNSEPVQQLGLGSTRKTGFNNYKKTS